MNVDGDGNTELRALNQPLQDEKKTNKNGVVSEEQGLLEENELKSNGIADGMKDEQGGAGQAHAVMHTAQSQPQGAMVCWDRFLHLRTLKVLLVENDDSTRHVVTALLRNCSYEVIEAANALQAWKILENLTNHIDLVLTEVVMPCLSGIGLLCKIMSHKTRKNVPVIMMSSYDSMGIVFKCLSKGAVDFLVKPIRKNELKNLWQHVWRRCHSSSGSGSGSGSESGNKKSLKSKSVEKSDNNIGSNDEEEDQSIGLNVGDGSDNGSGTQSSWTKQAVEVESPRPVSAWDRIPECPDSTCAQVVHSNAEASGNNVVLVPERECLEEKELDNEGMGKDLEIGMPRNHELEFGFSNGFPAKLVRRKDCVFDCSSRFNEQLKKGQVDLNSESPSSNLKREHAALAEVSTNIVGSLDSTASEAPTRLSKVSDINDKTTTDSKEQPFLELRLKRLRGAEEAGKAVQDDRNVLRRSDSSAFTRYNKTSNSNKALTGNGGSSSLHDSGMETVNKEVMHVHLSHKNCDPPYQCLNGESNDIDMGSTTNYAFMKSFVVNGNSAAGPTVHYLHSSSVFQKNDIIHAPEQVLLNNTNESVTMTMDVQPKFTHKEPQIQHFVRPYHHLQHVVHGIQQQLPPEHDELALKKMAAAATRCGSSNVMGGTIEGTAANYSVNGSASGSNHGSNGQNGTGITTAGGINMESENGMAGKSGSGDVSGSGSGCGNRVDQNKFPQREAALSKFRQKRKDRCFQKKVRYQSRKKLAEQRPRLRGQFVRQTTTSGNTNTSADS